MTQYPNGHQGYNGRMGEESDDGFVSFADAKKKPVSMVVIVVIAAAVAAAGTGFAYQQGHLDGLISTVEENKTVQDIVGKDTPSGTLVTPDQKDDEESLKVTSAGKKKKGEPVREIFLDGLEEKAATGEKMKGTFKFIDGKGVVHVVDDYSKIPKRYRKGAKRIDL